MIFLSRRSLECYDADGRETQDDELDPDNPFPDETADELEVDLWVGFRRMSDDFGDRDDDFLVPEDWELSEDGEYLDDGE